MYDCRLIVAAAMLRDMKHLKEMYHLNHPYEDEAAPEEDTDDEDER
jgi:hypothetical protein